MPGISARQYKSAPAGEPGSGVEEGHLPSVGRAGEQLALVEAVIAAFPEFNPVGDETVSRPELRPGNRPAVEVILQLFEPGAEIFVGGKRLALSRRPCAQLAAPRPGRPVRVGFFVADEEPPLEIFDLFDLENTSLDMNQATEGGGFITSRAWNDGGDIVEGYYLTFEILEVP